MPKTNYCRPHNPFAVIAQARVERSMREQDLYKACGIKKSTWANRKNRPECLTLEEIREIDLALNLSGEQLIKMIRG